MCADIEYSPADKKTVYIDANTRIQVHNTMLLLPQAEKEQCAAFIVRPFFWYFVWKLKSDRDSAGRTRLGRLVLRP